MKEETGQRFHCDGRNHVRTRFADFIAAYNFACKIKTSDASHFMRTLELDVRARPIHNYLIY